MSMKLVSIFVVIMIFSYSESRSKTSLETWLKDISSISRMPEK